MFPRKNKDYSEEELDELFTLPIYGCKKLELAEALYFHHNPKVWERAKTNNFDLSIFKNYDYRYERYCLEKEESYL